MMSPVEDVNHISKISVCKDNEEMMLKMKDSVIPESQGTCKWIDSHIVVVRCEAVLEILSVKIHCQNRDCEVYGDIYVHDNKDNKCFIYEKDVEDSETVYNDVKLSLTGPDDAMSMDTPIICFNIWDKLTGTTIIDGCAPLLKTIDTAQCHQFEQFMEVTLSGTTDTCAVVEYLALSFGVFCCVEVQLLVQQEVEIEVYGRITAEYTLYHSRRKVIIDLFEINKDSSDSEIVTADSYILLSRSVVAVPAYSSLTIRVNLWNRADNNLLVVGSCMFDTSNYGPSRKIIPGPNCFNAQVTIAWTEPCMLGRSVASVSPYILSDFMYKTPNMVAHRVVEVFSIFIGRENDEQISLYGTVKFDAAHGYINIFNRDKNNPHVLYPGWNFLPLEDWCDALVPGDRFHISVDLEDVDNRVSIKGFEHSSYPMNDYSAAWYNRLLCCVIKGAQEHSFAALHYTVFSDALKATLKVVFNFRSKRLSGSYSIIHGSIVATYGKYGRKTSYERLYNRNVLFERSEQNFLKVPCKDFDMELSKSMIAVPCRSTLHILVNLTCSLSTGFETNMRGVTMVIPAGKETAVLEGGIVGLTIFVKWSQA